jgi:hypothetical protein
MGDTIEAAVEKGADKSSGDLGESIALGTRGCRVSVKSSCKVISWKNLQKLRLALVRISPAGKYLTQHPEGA